MIKTLLGIVGSPRKAGNSELFIKELHKHLPDGWKLKLARLPEMRILPCKACYQCIFGDMKCPQKDDFQTILDALAECDAYVVAAPTYLLGANASLKQFLDRGLSFYGSLDRLWGKPAVGAAIAGIDGMEGYAKLSVDSFIKLTMGDHRGSKVLYGALPGEIFLKEGGREAAAELARSLLHGGTEEAASAPRCPTCGGDTFRFLSDGKARCMLCSSAGSYATEDGRLRIQTKPGDHHLFLTYNDARHHAEWLRGMKDQFLARRKEIKAVAEEYARLGEWVSPSKSEESQK